jgi:hypothetical protein
MAVAVAVAAMMAIVALTLTTPITTTTTDLTCLGAAAAMLDNRVRWQVHTSSGTRKLELNADVIADILAATHAMPSWKACQMENTSWSGTADENIQKYVSSIGVEISLSSNTAERTGAFLVR